MKASKTRALTPPLKPGLVALALSRAAGVALLLALPALGCGGEEWQSSGVGPQIETETQALVDPTSPTPPTAAAPTSASAGTSMDGDMVAMPLDGDVESVHAALTDGSKKAGDPKVFYLFYANGKDLPATDVNACKGAPPRFNCTFAPTLAECQRQIQTYLDKWYADLNVVFTLTRPTSGRFYTEVVSSGGGAWCDVSPKVAGVAPFLCRDLDGGVAYTFLGGTSARQTAIIIAQEQGHLVGLEHTSSTRDLMYPSICSDCDGFRDEDLPVDGDRCDRKTQNSYQMMKDRLGTWGGGPKPSAFGCVTDLTPPTIKILEPLEGAKVKKNFSLKVEAKDDCDLTSVKVQVMPQSLKAESYAPPFEWDLTNISGVQTITITATDGFGHVTKVTTTVTAPLAVSALDATTGNAAGCAVVSSAFGLAGLLPALGVLVVFARRRRFAPAQRVRAVTGALKSDPTTFPAP